jgi:hypothetical protein
MTVVVLAGRRWQRMAVSGVENSAWMRRQIRENTTWATVIC